MRGESLCLWFKNSGLCLWFKNSGKKVCYFQKTSPKATLFVHFDESFDITSNHWQTVLSPMVFWLFSALLKSSDLLRPGNRWTTRQQHPIHRQGIAKSKEISRCLGQEVHESWPISHRGMLLGRRARQSDDGGRSNYELPRSVANRTE